MQFSIDHEKVFQAARELGFTKLELYQESSKRIRLKYYDNIFRSDEKLSQGLSLSGVQNEVSVEASFALPDTEGLIAFLKDPSFTPPPSSHRSPNLDQETQAIATVPLKLKTLARHAFDRCFRLEEPRLEFEVQWRHFAIANLKGKTAHGKENPTRFLAQWLVPFKDQRLSFESFITRHTLEPVIEKIADAQSLRGEVERSVQNLTPWPVPQGNYPVVWSSKALAQVCQCFLTAFEADRVLQNRSFLTHCQLPLPIHFSIGEQPAKDAFDHEGSPRKPVKIFAQGRPRSLACKHKEASALEVPSTGHARRPSYQSPAQIGFWQPTIQGTQTQRNLLDGLEHGLSVHDLRVKHFSPETGELDLEVTSAHLIHQGKEGEPTESFTLKANVVDLLASLEKFSADPDTIGLANPAKLPIEITTPAALSPQWNIAGSVPESHYW